jgi:hypothetical protein
MARYLADVEYADKETSPCAIKTPVLASNELIHPDE